MIYCYSGLFFIYFSVKNNIITFLNILFNPIGLNSDKDQRESYHYTIPLDIPKDQSLQRPITKAIYPKIVANYPKNHSKIMHSKTHSTNDGRSPRKSKKCDFCRIMCVKAVVGVGCRNRQRRTINKHVNGTSVGFVNLMVC